MGPSTALRLGSGNLYPSLLGIELLGVTAGQNVECVIGVLLEVDDALRILVGEPVRRHKVGDEHAADLIAVLVVLDRIANLASPEYALRILVGAVEPRINCHLANFVGRAHADTRLICENGFDEDLGDRQAFIGQVVVSERAGLIAVVQKHHPPGAGGGRLVLRNKAESRISNTPDWLKIEVPLLGK